MEGKLTALEVATSSRQRTFTITAISNNITLLLIFFHFSYNLHGTPIHALHAARLFADNTFLRFLVFPTLLIAKDYFKSFISVISEPWFLNIFTDLC